jgi:hypothetical protein|tara:strand:+ start:458 stop:679 length:222 start_codon:yes stop_codon:yes gene_type:complete
MPTAQNMGGSPENPFKYDDICQIVGHLYLDSFHKSQTMELHATSMIEQLRTQNSTLIKEVKELEEELEKRDGV